MKKGQRSYKTTTTTEMDYTRVIKIAVGVLLVLGVFYFLTALSNGEIDFKGKNSNDKKETVIEYQEIMAGSIFNRNAKEYYVLLSDGSDNYTGYFKSLISTYNAKDNSLPFYTVDLEKKVNSQYKILDDDTNTYSKPTDIDNLKVLSPTILKIKDGKAVDVIVGQEKILEFFNK